MDDGITYLCMADEESGKRIPFAFLEDIKNRFRATYGDRGKTAIAYGMNTDFSRVLQNQMVRIITLVLHSSLYCICISLLFRSFILTTLVLIESPKYVVR